MLVAALGLALLAAEPEAPMRGMTVSCPGYGRIWGSPKMEEATRQLHQLGVRWIAIHPYGSVATNGAIRFEDPSKTGYMIRSVDITKKAGHQIFWKPHLAYWGSFEWRGSISFEGEGDWQRFFAGYEAFIVAHARFAEAKRIPLLAIGLEYEQTVHRERDWRRVISAVRKVYSGKITYGANWDGIEKVRFWDALDLIGVQAYFPLTHTTVDQSWDATLSTLEALSKKYDDKRILFTEIGYPRSTNAALEPWKPANDTSQKAIALRRNLMDQAFSRMKHPRIAGAFWWKWIPGNNFWDRDFSMRDDEALSLLRHHWGHEKRR